MSQNAPDTSPATGDDAYDPAARRPTPLAKRLASRIEASGPCTVSDFMETCLQDPEHGYYRRRAAIGAQGDFTTAPEISQIFGEIIGLWIAVVWQMMGSPERFNLIELGPGRGTLMQDALRANARIPGLPEAICLHLIETNTELSAIQRRALAPLSKPLAGLEWHTSIAALHEADPQARSRPTIVIGNEFLDTAPAEQVIRTQQGWRCRTITSDANGSLQFAGAENGPTPSAEALRTLEDHFEAAGPGDLVTLPDYRFARQALAGWPAVAALLIDYGHETPHPGDTLQAVRNHRFEHPLTSPGEADLTTQVDFTRAIECLTDTSPGLSSEPLTTQAEFLGRLGALQRGSKLMSGNPSKAGRVESGLLRLMAPTGMGTRFKVLGLRTPSLPQLPGFET